MSADNHATRATIGGEKIENKEINLLDKLFEIPVYQRLYAWGKDEIETLLDDMKKAFDDKKENYFIGNITTSIKTNKDGQDNKNDETNKIYVLIDGQQRLTTLWFIGFYLASQNCPNWKEFIMQGENLRIAMPIRDDEENALTELAKNINGKENLAQSLQGYGVYQNIIDAFKCIESWFVNGNGKNIDLANFAKYIYENVCFVFVTLVQNTDLNRFFVRMNNRGKQLGKHEILKARILGEIRKVYDKNNNLKQDESDEIWKKYAKIWDLCSDMDKYIFQSASDGSILKSKSQNENSTESSNNNDSLVKIADIVEKYKNPETNKSKEKDSSSKVESIIDFPTFLLHCYKLWVAKKCKYKIDKIAISKYRLLEIMWDNKIKNEENVCYKDFILNDKDSGNAKQNCKKFIIFMLQIRVLFDYFVIKNTLGDDGFAIMRFYESNGSYQPKAKSFEKLAMIQNYLRVARQGEKQNYEHWLTEFLEFLSSDNLQSDEIKEIKEFVDNFLSNKDKNELPKSLVKKESQKDEPLIEKLRVLQEKLVAFLEEKDTEQIRNVNLKEHYKQNGNFTIDESFLTKYLSNGVKTPHYWFYRLEYYLWKNGVENEGDLKIKDKGFGDIRKKFYFRNLGSIEHFQPQSEPDEKWWLNNKSEMDIFGNLALISRSLNSSLGKQNLEKK